MGLSVEFGFLLASRGTKPKEKLKTLSHRLQEKDSSLGNFDTLSVLAYSTMYCHLSIQKSTLITLTKDIVRPQGNISIH